MYWAVRGTQLIQMLSDIMDFRIQMLAYLKKFLKQFVKWKNCHFHVISVFVASLMTRNSFPPPSKGQEMAKGAICKIVQRVSGLVWQPREQAIVNLSNFDSGRQ